jgi:hypothetical protein
MNASSKNIKAFFLEIHEISDPLSQSTILALWLNPAGINNAGCILKLKKIRSSITMTCK